MTTYSFGGLLKDCRLRRNLTQSDVAFAMGWSEPSRLSRIEQGKTEKPARATVNRLMNVLRLERNERGQLLLSGGYLPTKQEVEMIRKEVKPLLSSWVYPAYLLDFAWRLIAWNKKAARVYAIDGQAAAWLRKDTPCSLEIIFNPDFQQNKYLTKKSEIKKWQEVLLGKLVRFRLSHQGSTTEAWYQEFLQKMMKNKLFNTTWQKAQQSEHEHGVSNYEHKLLVDPKNTNKRFDFHIFRSSLLQDARFEINYHIPGNVETLRYFQGK